MVGTFHDFGIVFNDNDGVAARDECLEGAQQAVDVVEVKPRGRLVENEKCGNAALQSEIVCQLHALVLAAGEGGAGLPEFDVAESDVLQGAQATDDARLTMFGEELDGAIDGHVQNVVDVHPFIFHLQDVLLETFAVAGFTLQHEVRHELHLHLDRALALALFAASAFGVEGEPGGGHLHLFRQWLCRHEFSDFIVRLDVGDGIGARTAPDGVLVDELDALHGVNVAFQARELSGAFRHFVLGALQSAEEDVTHQRRFSRAADAGDHGEDVERKDHVNAFEVVGTGSDNLDETIPGAAGRRHGDGFKMGKIVERVGSIFLLSLRQRRQGVGTDFTLEHDFAAKASRVGSHVNEIVRSAHDFFVVLHDNDGVAEVAEFFQDSDETLRVSGMQSDAGFVENVERADQRGPEGSGEVDALALTAGKGVGEAVEGEIAETDIDEEAQPGADFGEQPTPHRGVMFAELQVFKPRQQLADRHPHELGDAAPADFDIFRLGAQARAVAVGAFRLAAIACQHDAILYLILITLQHSEEGIDGDPLLFGSGVFFGVAVPEEVLLLPRELVVGFKDGKVLVCHSPHELLEPESHFLAAPANDRSIVEAEARVGHDQMLVDAHDSSEAFTARTGTDGIVEGEHVVVGLGESHSVCFEAGAETVEDAGGIEAEHTFSIAFVECRFDGVGESRASLFVLSDAEAGNEKTAFFGLGRIFQHVFHSHHFSVHIQAGETLCEVRFKLLLHGASASDAHRSEHGEACTLTVGEGARHDVIDGVAFHFLPADGREGVTDAGEEEAEIFVDFRARSDCGAGVSADGFLFDGDGGRQAFDVVHLGFVHSSEKLACVGREAFDIASLPFGVEGVESEGGLSGAGESGDDNKTSEGDFKVNVFQIVDPCSFDENGFVHAQKSVKKSWKPREKENETSGGGS